MSTFFFATKPFAQEIIATGVKSDGQRHPTADEANRSQVMREEPKKAPQTPSGGAASNFKKIQLRALVD